MSYSSVWIRVPLAPAASMIGWIVFCCTLASMRSTTCPPRWIRPRIGGLSFASVPRPRAPASPRRGPRPPPFPPPPRPWGGAGPPPLAPRRGLAFVPGHDVALVDLPPPPQPHGRDLGNQA